MIDFEFEADGAFVKRLLDAPEAELPDGFTGRVMSAVRAAEARRRAWRRTLSAVGFAAAAALAVMLALPLGRPVPDAAGHPASGTGTLAAYRQAFSLDGLSGEELDGAVASIVALQDASGAWAHPRLTKCNVAALARAASRGSSGARMAYKRGLRWLHANGLEELSSEEFAKEARMAVAWHGGRSI